MKLRLYDTLMRSLAHQEKRWAAADALRDMVRELGYEIEDTAQGPQVRAR